MTQNMTFKKKVVETGRIFAYEDEYGYIRILAYEDEHGNIVFANGKGRKT